MQIHLARSRQLFVLLLYILIPHVLQLPDNGAKCIIVQQPVRPSARLGRRYRVLQSMSHLGHSLLQALYLGLRYSLQSFEDRAAFVFDDLFLVVDDGKLFDVDAGRSKAAIHVLVEYDGYAAKQDRVVETATRWRVLLK